MFYPALVLSAKLYHLIHASNITVLGTPYNVNTEQPIKSTEHRLSKNQVCRYRRKIDMKYNKVLKSSKNKYQKVTRL